MNERIQIYNEAQKALKKCSLSHASPRHLMLDSSDTMEMSYEEKSNVRVSNSYPDLEPDTWRAFRSKLKLLGVNMDRFQMGLTTSVFTFLKATFFKLNVRQLRANQTSMKLLISADQYGFFYKIARYTEIEVVLVDTNRDRKISLEDLRRKLIESQGNEASGSSCVAFLFSNPVNPNQLIYSQAEVDEISDLLSEFKIDIIFDDITNMETCECLYDRRLLSSTYNRHDDVELLRNILALKRRRCHSTSDIDMLKSDEQKCGTFIKTKLVNRTIALWSPAKSYTAASRISCIAIPKDMLESKYVTYYNETCFGSQLQWRVQEFLLKKTHISHILSIQHYRSNFELYKQRVFEISLALSRRLGISFHPFIRTNPVSYQASNVLQLDFSGFRHFRVDQKRIANGIDVFDLLVKEVEAKTIPAEANFISATEVRVSLGVTREKVEEFCSRLAGFLTTAEITKTHIDDPA